MNKYKTRLAARTTGRITAITAAVTTFLVMTAMPATAKTTPPPEPEPESFDTSVFDFGVDMSWLKDMPWIYKLVGIAAGACILLITLKGGGTGAMQVGLAGGDIDRRARGIRTLGDAGVGLVALSAVILVAGSVIGLLWEIFS